MSTDLREWPSLDLPGLEEARSLALTQFSGGPGRLCLQITIGGQYATLDARGARQLRDELTAWLAQQPREEVAGPPAERPLLTAELEQMEGLSHAFLRVFNRGGYAGSLTVNREDAEAIRARLAGAG